MDSDVSDGEDDVVLLQIGESSDDDGSDSKNDEILQPRKPRPGRPCTTYLIRHFYGDPTDTRRRKVNGMLSVV